MNESSQNAVGLAAMQDPALISAMQYLKDQGFVLPKDGVAARAWCEVEAKLGMVDAQIAFGQLLNFGIFGDEDTHAARFWYQCAADKQNPVALTLLAGFVESGSDSEAPNPQGATRLLQHAAEMGYAPAMVSLAIQFLHGIHVEKDEVRAAAYLEMAAELGDALGQFLLAGKLRKEKNFKANAEGIRWLKLAADNGHAGAHRVLGYLYMDDRDGFEEDKEKSDYHFSMATQIEDAAVAELG
jgi:uncharacterized protein